MAERVEKPRLEDGRFIKEKFGQFWERVRNTEELGALWQTYAQIVSSMMQRLYELDSDISIEDIQPNQLEMGEKIELDNAPVRRIDLPDDVAGIPEIHNQITYPKTIYVEGVDYEVVNDGGDKYIDFVRGSNPQSRLNAEDIGNESDLYVYIPLYLKESRKIERRFGALTGLEGEDSEEYLRAVRGLWFAQHFGPTPHNLRVALYILFDLPFTNSSGIIQDVDRDNNTVSVDNSLDREIVSFKPTYPQYETFTDEREGRNFIGIVLEDELPDSLRPPVRLYAGYESEQNPENFDVQIDDRFWEVNGRTVYIRADYYRSISFETQNLFLAFRTQNRGDLVEYDLGRLDIRDDLSAGDPIDRFDLLTENIEIRDMHTHEPEWIYHRRPPGLFHIIVDGPTFTQADTAEEVFDFFNRFKPSYSDFDFFVRRLPAPVTTIGEPRPANFWRQVIESHARKLFSTEKDVVASTKIEHSPEQFHDANIEPEIDHYIYWDHFTHSYSQKNDIPKTWGELHEEGRQWDEYHADEIPRAQWDQASGVLSLKELNDLYEDESIYLEVDYVPGEKPKADVVRANIEGNPDAYGTVTNVDLDNGTFTLNASTTIENIEKTLWGSGPHWDRNDLQWDQSMHETVPVWDVRDISWDREWGDDDLTWDPDAEWPIAPYVEDVTWDEYGQRWDLHTLYGEPDF